MRCFFFSSRRRHTIWTGDWSSDVCSSDLLGEGRLGADRLGFAVGHHAALILSLGQLPEVPAHRAEVIEDRKSTRLNSSHPSISYAVFCLKKKKKQHKRTHKIRTPLRHQLE